MKIAKVKLPDGRIAKFQVSDDATEQDVMNFVKDFKFDEATNESVAGSSPLSDVQPMQEVGERRELEQKPVSKYLQQGAGATQNLLQGASFGLADEARGALRGLGYGIGAGITGREPIMQAAQRGYREGTDIARQEEQQFAQEMPKTALAANIAGGFANPLNKVGAGFVGRGATTAGKLARGVGVGAGMGAGYGAGSAVEDERLGGATSGAAFGAAIPLAGVAAKTVGKAIAPALGMTTGAGKQAIQKAFEAGKKGSKSFTKNLRGKDSIENVVEDAKSALDIIKQRKNLEYSQQIGKTINDPTVLDINPIIKKTLDVIDDQSVGGFSKVGKETSNKINEIVEIIGDFQSKPEIHNAMGFDALKRRLSDINIPYENRQAERIRTNLVNSVKDTITKQAPEYAKTMKNYSQASDLISEIERSLNLGRKSSVDTAMRKLQSVMRDNVQTNYGQRLDLVKQLESVGNANILDSLAGHALSSPMPRGLGGSSLGGMLGIGGIAHNPALLGTLPLFSPRAVGEASLVAGKGAKIADVLLGKGKGTTALIAAKKSKEKDKK